MSFERLQTEVIAALELGSDITDTLLGFGIYDQLTFLGKPVGFAIYGIAGKHDIRLKTGFEGRDSLLRLFDIFNRFALHGEGEEPPDSINQICKKGGRLLRKIHEKEREDGFRGFVHHFPHAGNLSVVNDTVRWVDLDTAKPFAEYPPELCQTLLYLDLSKAMRDFYTHKAITRRGKLVREVSLVPFLAHFLWGYFKEDTNLPFVRHLETLVNGNGVEVGRAHDILGRTQKEMPGDSPRTVPRRLIKARDALEHEGQENINLRDIAESDPVFDAFYQGLGTVAESLTRAA